MQFSVPQLPYFYAKFKALYKSIIRPFFFLFDPEKVHHFTFKLIAILQAIPGVAGLTRALFVVEDERLAKEVFGLKFPIRLVWLQDLIKTQNCLTSFQTTDLAL